MMLSARRKGGLGFEDQSLEKLDLIQRSAALARDHWLTGVGRVPVVGDFTVFDDHRIVVQEVEGRRVSRVLVSVIPPATVTQLEEPNEYVDGCFEEGGEGSCAMPDYAAGVAASEELQEQVPAFTDMLAQMQIPVGDMDAMIAEVDVEERDADEVAQEWVEANADVVASWVG